MRTLPNINEILGGELVNFATSLHVRHRAALFIRSPIFRSSRAAGLYRKVRQRINEGPRSHAKGLRLHPSRSRLQPSHFQMQSIMGNIANILN
jgi:hypothetical protein